MKKPPLAFIATLAVAAAITLTSAPANAGANSPGCVTRVEYRAVKRGMTKARVHAGFDTVGARGEASRHYRACNGSTVVVEYTPRVVNKFRIPAGTVDPPAR